MTRANEGEKKLKGSKKHVCFLEEKLFVQRNLFSFKDATAAGYHKLFAVLVNKLARLPADVKRLTKQSTADEDLLEDVPTALRLPKAASQQRASSFSKELEKWMADKAVAETEMSKPWQIHKQRFFK